MTRALLAVSVPALLALASCTSSETLDPSALRPDAAPSTESALPPLGQSDPSSQQQQAALSRPASVQLAPLVGATETAAAPLAARLAALAAERGIAVASQEGAAAEFVLRGYFSAFTENRQTTVIFVWDVLDPSGSRLHRIQGQEREESAEGEGWNAVTARTMEAIAEQTVNQLATWLSGRAG